MDKKTICVTNLSIKMQTSLFPVEFVGLVRSSVSEQNRIILNKTTRKGFVIKKNSIESELQKSDFEVQLKKLERKDKLVYFETKLSHSGLTGYKVFENCYRKIKNNSLKNLVQLRKSDSDIIQKYIVMYRCLKTVRLKKMILIIAKEVMFVDEYEELLRMVLNKRKLNETQSRKIKSYANKLCYYSQVRKFQSKKSGEYKFKVSFLTITAPESANESQILKAFEHFLDYLRRTANCTYVWKKELGEYNKKLHIHLLINNFIPYYIVNWKWKRLLLAEGVVWPKNEKGEDTSSHYRIELPRSRKLIAHYIAKYLSKAYPLPKEYGYISGHSEVLESCKEYRFIENDLPRDEIEILKKHYRTIQDQFITHICVDLRTIQKIAPTIFFHFDKMFKDFQDKITLPQKFWYT